MSKASEHLIVTKGITVQLGAIDNSVLATTTGAAAKQLWYIDKLQTDVQHMIRPGDVTIVLNDNLTVKELPEVDYYGEVMAEPWILGYGHTLPNTTVHCTIPQNLLPLPDDAIVHVQCVEFIEQSFEFDEDDEEETSPLLLAVSLPDGTFNGNVISTTPSTWNKVTGECVVHFDKPVFPNKTNVNFVQIKDRDNVEIITWERGAGLTLACGTGATAVGVLTTFLGLTNSKVNVKVPGGVLIIEYPEHEKDVFMTGPSEKVAEGYYNYNI